MGHVREECSGGPASAKALKQGCGWSIQGTSEARVGDSEQGTERQSLMGSVPRGMESPGRVLSRE